MSCVFCGVCFAMFVVFCVLSCVYCVLSVGTCVLYLPLCLVSFVVSVAACVLCLVAYKNFQARSISITGTFKVSENRWKGV